MIFGPQQSRPLGKLSPPDPPWRFWKACLRRAFCLHVRGNAGSCGKARGHRCRCPRPFCPGQGRTPRSKAVTPAPRQRAASSLRAHREAPRRQHHGGDPPDGSRRLPALPAATRNPPLPARTHAPLRRAFHRGARPAPGQGKARCTSTAAEARVTATATTTATAEKATALASQTRVSLALPAPCAATPMRGRLSARP